MIHEITPHQFNNSFFTRPPEKQDIVLYFDDNLVLIKKENDGPTLPRFCDFKHTTMDCSEYLFSIDHIGFFLISGLEQNLLKEFEMVPVSEFRTMPCQWMAFGGITGSQLYRWKQTHKYCGRCAAVMENSKTERALCCPNCGCIEYPKISPAVIVAITDGDRLLLARAKNSSYKRFALIAGFVEVGETFEQTVHREILEEVGLKVKNIRYYKNQPWSFSDTVMIGFYADLDGDDTIKLQESELSEARWFYRNELPETVSNASIGNELIETFRHGGETSFMQSDWKPEPAPPTK